MYTLGAFLLLALLLGSVTSVVDSVLNTVGLGGIIKKIPIIGAHWGLVVSILMMYVIGADIAGGWMANWGADNWGGWMGYIVNGAIVYGMIPVKDAVISMIGKGFRA